MIHLYHTLRLISIHTPAKGVTLPSESFRRTLDFNPHSREGSDTKDGQPKLPNNFNPHSREGSDKAVAETRSLLVLNFNPHSREGSDDNRNALIKCNQLISIHTPAKGVTEYRNDIILRYGFQSTLPRRE